MQSAENFDFFSFTYFCNMDRMNVKIKPTIMREGPPFSHATILEKNKKIRASLLKAIFL